MMRKNITQTILVACFILLATPAFADLIDARTLFANALAKEFYCNAATLLSGTLGVIVGLGATTYGFYKIMLRGPSFGNIFISIAGLFFTVIPVLFENGMDMVGQIFSSLGGKTTVVANKFAGKTITCDFGSEALRPYLVTGFIDTSTYTSSFTGTVLDTDYATGISNAESRGCTGADGTSYTCNSGNGAYGKYQFRLTYARDVLGMPNLTAAQFLASNSLQDQAFQTLTSRNQSSSYYNTVANLISVNYGATGTQASNMALAVMHNQGMAGAVTCLQNSSACVGGHDATTYLRNAGFVE